MSCHTQPEYIISCPESSFSELQLLNAVFVVIGIGYYAKEMELDVNFSSLSFALHSDVKCSFHN